MRYANIIGTKNEDVINENVDYFVILRCGMTRGKSINLFLMDGDVNGRVKCSIANWTGLAFKIPRTSLNVCKDRPELRLR